MRRTVNFKKMVSVIVTAFMMVSMFAGFTANAEVFTYRKVTYLAGDVDGITGSTEAVFNKVIGTSFKTADTSRFARNGYELDSWTLSSTGQTVSANATYIMPSYDITFTANWKPATYSVTFTGKGGKTASGSANVYASATYGTTITLPENEFVYGNYTFAGWKYAGVVYGAGEEFEVPAITSGSKIVFAATWTTAPAVTTAPVTTTMPETTTTTTEITTEEVTTTEETTTTVEATTEEVTTTEETTTTVEMTTEEVTTTEETTTVEETTEEVTTTEETTTTVETTTEEVTTTEETTTVEETEVTVPETEIPAEENENVIGDYNNDGVVDGNDVYALRKYVIGVSVEGFEIDYESADVNNDGVVNVFDCVLLSRIVG